MMLSIAVALGLLLTWVGERIAEAPGVRFSLTGVGALLVVGAFGLRLFRGRQPSGTAAVQRTLAGLHGLAVLALGLYALQSDLFTKAFGHSLESGSPILAGSLAVLWPAVLAISLIPTLLIELSFAAMARAPKLEDGRIREALYAGLALAFVLIFAISLQYVATERDGKVDLSYFRVAKPGEATRKLVASLDTPVEAFLFFPPASDSGELVKGYFEELAEGNQGLQVAVLDYALEPLKAKELGATSNGSVVLRKGSRKESLFIGAELEKARPALRSLDGDVQKRLLQVAKAKRTVYLTAGHGERTQEPMSGDDRRSTVDLLWKLLQEQNFDVRVLSAAEGLGQDVPKDAAAVVVVGPQRPFTAPEAATLAAYEKRGGRVFLALDPETGLGFEELLTPLGLKMTREPIAQERSIATIHPPASVADRVNIGTRGYSSHPSVTNLARAQSPVLLAGAAGLDELPAHAADLQVDFAVRSLVEAWNDVNHNFQFDAESQETKKAWGLMAAVNRRLPGGKPEDELRALVLGDSDAISDDLLQQLIGNRYLVVDGVKWLLGDEQLAGMLNSEVDVPLTRSRQAESAWFYGTTFLVPIAVVGLGFVARRRVKKPAKEVTP